MVIHNLCSMHVCRGFRGSSYLNMALLARASENAFKFSNNCFYKFFFNCMELKLIKKLPSILSPHKQSFRNTRFINTARFSENNQKTNRYVVFDEVMSQRRDQAKRSILVQVQSKRSSYELYDYCSKYGQIQEMHHYMTNSNMHFVLIEFKTISDIKSISSVSTHANIQQHLPVVSPMLWFRAMANTIQKGSSSENIPMTVTNGKVFLNSEMINNKLFNGESISDQMMILWNSTKLNDTDTRLRFLTARQVEICLSGMFSNISVLPFGSSVNGCGKHGCDLDLVLKLQDDKTESVKGRLIYHTKDTGLTEKVQAQRVMETISDIMRQFLPGVTGIRKILNARVPIIKYNQILTGLECDLSMTNTTGIHMSELLYLYGELDWRVRPLIFTIRMWARCVQLTNSSPGSWITNFSLTLLVLFYLQHMQILPSLQHLVKLASTSDIRIADSSVDCTFLRDISKLPKSSVNNNHTLQELLANFFIFYSSFDFETKAVSLNAGMPLSKPDTSSVFIYNPLEQGLNVTKNMNIQETERLKVEFRNAALVLESTAENKNIEWGLLGLFHQRVTFSEPVHYDQKGRIVELSSLFPKSSTIGKASKDMKDNLNISVSASIKNDKNSSVSTNLDRQVTRNAKSRSNQKQQWRR